MDYARRSINEHCVGYKYMIVNDSIMEASSKDILKDGAIKVDEGDVIISRTSKYSIANLSLSISESLVKTLEKVIVAISGKNYLL